MTNLIIWGATIGLIILIFEGVARSNRRYRARTNEEYEEAVRSGKITGNALIRAGLVELDKLQHPSAEASIAFIEDEKQGQTKTEKEADNRDDDDPETRGLQPE